MVATIITIIILFHFAGILSIFHVLANTRTSQGAIAWLVCLLTIPYIAVPAYWFFGRSKFKNYVLSRRTKNEENNEITDALKKAVQEYTVTNVDSVSKNETFLHSVEKLATIPILNGNHAELLINGEDTFKSMMDGIDAAKEYILVQFFVIKDDNLGQRLKKHLKAKAKQDIKIYIIYDEVGSQELTKSYIQDCKESGIAIQPFNTRRGRITRFQINFRNHRKIVVVDGLKTWIGGHNVADAYVGGDPKLSPWRDTHTVIEGPAVMSAQLIFAEDWYWITGEKLEQINWTPTPAKNGANKEILIIPSGPADELETAALMFLHAINHAKKRIWIATPYFVPDEAFIYALQLAGLRNIDVRILIPEKTDHHLIYLASFAYIQPTALVGVKFYRYAPGFLHEKVVLIDDDISIVGSANFDNRSFRLNFEVSACIIDPDYAKQVAAMFEEDFKTATIIEDDALATKSWWFKFKVQLARLTSPIQ